jgi:zinc protease
MPRFSPARYLLPAVLLMAWALPARADGPPRKIASIEGITEYQLDNGLRVLLFPDNSKPKLTVNITILVGSRHEGYGETGMAHLLEHMLFKGTPTHPKIDKLMQARGANFNGTTWLDRTNYYETLPASDDNLEFAIKLEADRLVNSYVKREDLVSEMTVVRNEFEQGENSPVRILLQRMFGVAYEWHNYGKSTIGNRADIERVPIEKLQAFYKKYYQPDNAVLVVAGQFDEKKALANIEKYFGALPRPKRALEQTYTEEPAQDGERLVTLRRVGDGGLVGAMYHVPAGSHSEFAAVEVLAQILTDTPSGRLYQALVKSKKAAAVQSLAFALHDPGVLFTVAQVPGGGSLEDVRDTMLEVMEKLADKGVTADEVTRATRKLLADRENAAAQTTSIAVALSDWAAQGDWRLYFLHRDRLEKVKADDVNRVAAKYLKRANRTVGMFVPMEKPERVAIDQSTDYLKELKDYKGRDLIAAGEAFDLSPENIGTRTKVSTLEGGLKVALLSKRTRGETVNLQLTLRYGNENNLKGFEDAAQYLPPLMLRGTKNLTYQQFRDELDKLKAKITAAGSPGVITFRVEAKRSTLPAVLELLRQALREPALPSDELDTFKRLVLSSLEQQKKDPRTLAMQSVQRRLSPYPKGDVRYVTTVEEDIERTKALTLDQVRKLYEDFLGAAHGELVVVGDFDPTPTLESLQKMLAGWKSKVPYARLESKAKADAAGGRVQIETPDKDNANYAAQLVLPMNDLDPDYAPLVLANQILGGSTLASRLGDRVRQKEGLSYGIGSNFSAGAQDKVANLYIGAISNPANMPKVEKAILEEVELFRKDGVTQEELDRARDGYLQQLKVSWTSDSTLAGTLAGLLHTGRSMKHYAELEAKLKAVTPPQVAEAFRRHVAAGKLVIAVAGDFAKKGTGGSNPMPPQPPRYRPDVLAPTEAWFGLQSQGQRLQ